MRRQIVVIVCSVVLGLMTVSSAAMAQQKTAKECREEWRANKAANQANGVTEKAYVAQCRGGAAPAQPTAAPAEPSAPAPAPTAATSGQKTAKECREEWRANKAANQANGVTEKAYVAQCRGGAAPAQTTTAPAPPPTPTAAPAAPSPAPTASPATPPRPRRRLPRRPDRLRHRRPVPCRMLRQANSGRTNFQPKHRPGPSVLPTPSYGSI